MSPNDTAQVEEKVFHGMGGGVANTVVEGKAKLVRTVNASEVEDGEILITQMTDVNMVKAMSKSKAVVTALGGPLCHAAIVCAEYSKPFVVGAVGVMSIQTGDIVRINTGDGTVTVIGRS